MVTAAATVAATATAMAATATTASATAPASSAVVVVMMVAVVALLLFSATNETTTPATSAAAAAFPPCGYEKRKCGADIKTASVAMTVNSVKMIRHKRSTTMAANFQSFVISPFSSSLRNCFFVCLCGEHLGFCLGMGGVQFKMVDRFHCFVMLILL